MSNPPIPRPHPVQVHHYLPSSSSTTNEPPHPLQTYEHTYFHPAQVPAPSNALVFIGGLGDGPHTIPYVQSLVRPLSTLPSDRDDIYNGRYSVFEARLSSAFTGFGHGSLAQDAREIADLVRYLRRGLGMRRVVLMGHSTGCQDCLEYAAVTKSLDDGGEEEEEELEEAWATRVDGYILQGPVSDREAIQMGEDPVEVAGSLRVARGMVQEGKGGEVMERGVLPKGWRGSPVTAYRWASLAGVGGDDDYFSSDLSDDKLAAIWGRLERPVLIVPSEKDEWVPAGTDVMGLVRKWMGFCKPGIASELSGLIPGANHRVDNEAGQQWLADRVARFLAEIGK